MPSIFNKKLTHACKYCRYSTKLNFKEDVLCIKRGFNEPDGSCRHYKYDPLKREPNRIDVKKDFKKEDFDI